MFNEINIMFKTIRMDYIMSFNMLTRLSVYSSDGKSFWKITPKL